MSSIIDGHYSLSVSNRRIVILGKTGVGKSSVANTIFGEERFPIDHSLNSETSECQAATKSIDGRNITLIDTPGFFNTDREEDELRSAVVSCITECAPGPHAFLILLKLEKFTKQEQAVIKEINQYFSEEVFKYATVLFTHGDQLPEGQTIEVFVRSNQHANDLVRKCGGRCHVVDNKSWKNNQQEEFRNNQIQVKKLLKTIDEMVEANGGRCYTNEMLQKVEESIRQEEERIRQSPGNMSAAQIREEAKARVKWCLMAGITTGALLGALFGVLVMVKVVVLALDAGLALDRSAAKLDTTTTDGAAAAAAAAATAAARISVKTSVTALTVGAAVVGAGAGGVAGYYAAEGADTPLEAIKRAANAVFDGSQTIVDAVERYWKE